MRLIHVTWITYALLWAYNILDIIHTHIAVSIIGMEEWNPVVNWFMDKFGTIAGVILIKSVPLILLGIGIQWIYSKKEKVRPDL